MDERIVSSLYKNLSCGDTQAAAALLATDLEWRFHGPRGREHMMHVLTGAENPRICGFWFEPLRVAKVGKWVVAEGRGIGGGEECYWVHVWAVEGGVITQFREYFNTRITIRELGGASRSSGEPAMWESRAMESMPGLVLAA